MKKLNLLSVFFVILSAVSFTSCDTEPVDPVLGENIGQQPQQPGAAVFKVDFSGQTYVATSTIATVGDGLITIGGLKGTNGEMVSIIIEGTAAGTYDASKALMDYNPGGASEYSYTNFNLGTGEESGTVTITSINTTNKTISGTFSFTGWWGNDEENLPSVAFTNGQFENIPYTGGVPTGGEFFDATVDGQEFTYAGSDLAVAVAGGGGGTDIVSVNAYGDSHRLILTFPANITAGTYAFATGVADIKARYRDAEGVEYQIDGGSLTIVSNQGGWVKGNFSFQVKDDTGATIHTVTAGDFNLEIDF